MDNLQIKGEGNDKIIITLNETNGFPHSTSHFGGYDVKGSVKIISGNYMVTGKVWFTTGELYLLYKDLTKAYKDCEGRVTYKNYENNLELHIEFLKLGQVNITGRYKERPDLDNELFFNFFTDQSFISETIKELDDIAKKYGDMKGIK